MIEMGAAADPKLLKAAAEAHHKAIGSISGPKHVTSRADWDSMSAALGRASVPKEKVMAVYDSVKDITDPKVPAYMKSLVKAEDAEKAYKGVLEFKDVVARMTLLCGVGVALLWPAMSLAACMVTIPMILWSPTVRTALAWTPLLQDS